MFFEMRQILRHRVFPVVAVSVAWLAFSGPSTVQAADLPAGASGTVGQLIAAGGRQMRKEEILKQFAGATIEGSAMGYPDAKFLMRYAADGTANGKGLSPMGWAPIAGTWTANDRDQYCQDLQVQNGNAIKGCFFYFVMGDRLFAAQTDNKDAPVYERKLTR